MDLLHTSLHKSDRLHYCMCSLTFHKHVTALSSIHSQSYHHVKLFRTSCQHYQLYRLNIHMPPLLFHSQVSHIQAYTFQGRLSSLLCTVKTLMHLKLPFHKLSYIPEVNSVSISLCCVFTEEKSTVCWFICWAVSLSTSALLHCCCR